MSKNHKNQNEIYAFVEENQELQAQPQYDQTRKSSRKKKTPR